MLVKELRKQIKLKRQQGQITFLNAIRLQVALYNSAFAEAATQLAVMEAVAAENVTLPYNATGDLIVGEINWAEVIKQIIDILLPILLDLLDDWLS